MADPKCIPCAGKGFRWVRGRTGQAHMVKRQCQYCKGTGRAKQGKGRENG